MPSALPPDRGPTDIRLRPARPQGTVLGVIELRVLTPGDWPLWRELRLAALAEAPYAFGARLAEWQGEGDREERWRARLALPGSRNLVALLHGRPAGMASGIPGPDGRTAELISMWVGPGARGQGVGDRLIEAVAEWARRSGARVLRLDVAAGNDAAIALYRRHGFAVTGESGGAGHGGRCEHVMAKTLDPA
jgi:ribosomal protein S18 acetylase RimI-like enzyme